MRILIYYEQRGYGGTDTHLAHLLNNWPDVEDQFIIVSNPENEGLPFLKRRLRNQKVRLVELEGVFRCAKPEPSKLRKLYCVIATLFNFHREFNKLLRELSPHALVANNGGYPGALTNFYATILGRRYRKTSRSTFLLIHHSPVKETKIRPLMLLAGILARRAQAREVTSITVSRASKAALEKFTPIRDLQVIHNGLEVSQNSAPAYDFKANWNISSSKRIVGMIGPVDSHKGHLTMLEVFRTSDRLQQTAHFVVVGTCFDEMLEKLKTHAKDYGLERQVTFTGFLPGDSTSIVRGFDVLVMPTVDFEGFGYSMAEAMASGIPVVASRVGAIPEIIVDGESGYLVEVGDLFDWRNKLETLISDAEKRSQMGMAARTRIESCFTADSMSRKYHSLVHKAVHR